MQFDVGFIQPMFLNTILALFANLSHILALFGLMFSYIVSLNNLNVKNVFNNILDYKIVNCEKNNNKIKS